MPEIKKMNLYREAWVPSLT